MNRRCWLQTAGAAAVSTQVLHAAEAARVRITGLEAYHVRVNRRGNWVLFRLQSSEGLSGIGDASHSGSDSDTASLAESLLEAIRGRSVFEIEHLRHTALPLVKQRGRPAAVALGGLEQCLWDLQGQLLGVPVYQLFGGMLHPRIRCYANVNRSTEDRTPAGFAVAAERAIEDGFDAIKLAPWDGMPRQGDAAAREEHTQLGIDCTAAVRAAIGEGNDLLVDVHSNMSDRESALRLAHRLEPFDLFWMEEVAQSLDILAAVNREASMPTAGGESLFGVSEFYRYIAAGAVDIIMPDIKYCGGMLELKKVASIAEGAGVLTAPHGPASPVGHLAAAHVSATLPNFQILEYSFGEVPWRAELVDPPEALEKGRVVLSDRPGLGVTLNQRVVRAQAA